MKIKFLVWSFAFLCILFSQSCENSHTIGKALPIPEITNSFYDPMFDPYPDSELDVYFTSNTYQFRTDVAEGLSFTSDYIYANGDDDEFEFDALDYFNAYLVTLNEDPVNELPTFGYNFSTDDELSTAVENELALVISDLENLDGPIDEEFYEDYVEIIESWTPPLLFSSAKADTIASILYAHQMVIHWMVYEPLWYSPSQLNDDQIKPRGCRCWFCGCDIFDPIGVSDINWDCMIAPAAGALAGTPGGPAASLGLGLLAWVEFCP